MLKRMNRRIVAAVVVAAAAVGAGAAFAADRLGSPREESQAVIDDAAKQLGVEPSALSDALKTALKNRVDAAVDAGVLTKEQADEMKARIDASEVPLIGGFRHGPHGHFADFESAADYLGLSASELRTQLDGGKTLAEVAHDRGKSVDGLIAAMTSAVEKRLNEAVSAGRLTRAQADELLAHAKTRITAIVNGRVPKRPSFRHFGPLPRDRSF
jgi:ribosomal protein S20